LAKGGGDGLLLETRWLPRVVLRRAARPHPPLPLVTTRWSDTIMVGSD
jgi:hypothetical protein